jgi:hypothetical protein
MHHVPCPVSSAGHSLCLAGLVASLQDTVARITTSRSISLNDPKRLPKIQVGTPRVAQGTCDGFSWVRATHHPTTLADVR